MEPNNPYAPSKTPVEAGLRDGPPTAAAVPLGSVGQIMLAAWLGAANFAVATLIVAAYYLLTEKGPGVNPG